VDYAYLTPFTLGWYLSIVLLIVSTVGFVCLGRKLSVLGQKRLLLFMGLFLLCDVIFSQGYVYYQGLFDLQTSLPLTFCTVIKLMAAFAAIWGIQVFFEMCMLIGIFGPVVSFMLPFSTAAPDPYLFSHYFISHAMPVIITFYMIWCLGFTLRRNAILWVGLLFHPIVICVYFINLQLGSNYMFIMDSDEIAAMYAPIKWPYYIFLWFAAFYVIASLIQFVSNLVCSYLEKDDSSF
jgi:hypothetical integral membrane protein (TIGR02206 family)